MYPHTRSREHKERLTRIVEANIPEKLCIRRILVIIVLVQIFANELWDFWVSFFFRTYLPKV